MPRILIAFLILFSLVYNGHSGRAQTPPLPTRSELLTPAPTLKTLQATVTWLGNSFPGDGSLGHGDFVPVTLDDIAVSADGTVLWVCGFNEAYPQTVYFKNGKYVKSSAIHFGCRSAGYDPASNLFFAGVTQQGGVGTGPRILGVDKEPGVAWYDTKNPDYWMTQFSGEGRMPEGFAFNGDSIYVSEGTTNNIQVYSKKAQKWVSPIPVSGTHKMTFAAGLIWAVQGSSVIAIDPHASVGDDPAAGKVVRTLPSGDVLQPDALAVDKWGRLLVSDVHPDRRRIVIFDAKTGIRVATFGLIGGPWGPESVPGRAGNAVFEYPRGLGVDAAGNLYVADAGAKWPQNGSVTCYKPLATAKGWFSIPVWSVRGAAWSDTVAVDPNDSTVLRSAWFTYKFDYNALRGEGWRITGTTLNRAKYPNDPRLHRNSNGRYFRGLRVIEGKKFLFSGLLDVFRLGDTGEGETAVPCVSVIPRSVRFEPGEEGFPPNAPGYRDQDGYLWTDANGDGDYQASEFRSFTKEPYGEFHGGERSLWLYLDDAANIWYLPTKGDRGGFLYRMQGLKNDTPNYDDVNSRLELKIPAGDKLGQINYSCLNEKTGDLLVLSRRDGRSDMSLTCYVDWRALAIAGRGDQAKIRYRVDGVAQGPAINTDGGYSGDYIGGMRAKNEFLFLADAMGAGIRIYRVDTGAAVGRIDVGGLGARQPMDNTEGLQVSTRGTGSLLEYVIVRDCWLTNKMLMMRWRP